MKKFFMIAAVAAMVIACASKEEKYVKDFVAACEKGDTATVRKMVEEYMADTTAYQFTQEQKDEMEKAIEKAAKAEKE